MKYAIVLFTLFIFRSFPGSSQNVILGEGEFMDTTSVNDPGCKGYDNVFYYQVGGKYPENSASLLKETQAFLQEKNKKFNGSGYITFRFAIDCAGKMRKRVQVLQTDEKYRTTHFEKEFVNELFLFVGSLDKWKIAGSKNGVPYFYTTLITFKIKDGKVINIIP
jgi:hypothetical protein